MSMKTLALIAIPLAAFLLWWGTTKLIGWALDERRTEEDTRGRSIAFFVIYLSLALLAFVFYVIQTEVK